MGTDFGVSEGPPFGVQDAWLARQIPGCHLNLKTEDRTDQIIAKRDEPHKETNDETSAEGIGVGTRKILDLRR